MKKNIICKNSKSLKEIKLKNKETISKIFKNSDTEYDFKILPEYWDELCLFAEKNEGQAINSKMHKDTGLKIWEIKNLKRK